MMSFKPPVMAKNPMIPQAPSAGLIGSRNVAMMAQK
jgi:hypothetical protein